VVLDRVAAVAKAQHEVAMPEVRVVLHQVPDDRTRADVDHRLRNRLGKLAQASAEPAAEQHHFHRIDLRESERSSTSTGRTSPAVLSASPASSIASKAMWAHRAMSRRVSSASD